MRRQQALGRLHPTWLVRWAGRLGDDPGNQITVQEPINAGYDHAILPLMFYIETGEDADKNDTRPPCGCALRSRIGPPGAARASGDPLPSRDASVSLLAHIKCS